MKLCVVSHDAGGAELLSSWLNRSAQGYECRFCLAGPALKIFQSKKSPLIVQPLSALEDCIQSSQFVLTGTGWSSDLEKRAIRLARLNGVRVAAFLDHWCNYAERFCLNGETVLPDEIWVGDSYAMEMARAIFPLQPIKLVPNPYILDIKDSHRELAQKEPKTEKDKKRVLYLSEPVADHALKVTGEATSWGITELDLLREVIRRFEAYSGDQIECLRIRPHPSEKRDKFLTILEEYAGHILLEVGGDQELINDCLWADIVVGYQTMAMVVALEMGKRVFTCNTDPVKPICLPYPEIQKLFASGVP